MNDWLPHFNRHRASRRVLLAVLVTAAVSGYFMGLRQTRSQVSLTRPMELSSAQAGQVGAGKGDSTPEIASYSEVNRKRSGPNAGWRSDLHLLASPPRLALTTNAPPEFRAAAVTQRQARRAFDGAPPVVPHPITQDSSAACLVCHGSGLAVKDRAASKISHAHFGNCTQCHVPAGGPQIPTGDTGLREALSGNSFTGFAAFGPGRRAWPGAPPMIPHATQMRSDCLSCHGPGGLYGLRTPHVERLLCTQCHVPDARLDQRLVAHE
jgi:cytochrome c-type protein NapB